MRKVLVFAVLVVSCLGLTRDASYGAKINASLTHFVVSPQNAELDFTLVNKTGYKIKALYIGVSGTGDWTKDDEILKGKDFPNGQALDIKFHPRATAEKWDIMVAWADGSANVEWLNLKLTEITKVTLVYDRDKDKTSAIIE